jgi:hypothetical protein
MSYLMPVVYKVESLLFERSRRRVHSAIKFRIIHRFSAHGRDCAPGEEVFAIFLVIGDRAIQIPLALALRLLFDYLARHRYAGQSAGQIAAGMRTPFYRNHAANSGVVMLRAFSRPAVKEYVWRIRRSLAAAFERERVAFEPSEILASNMGEGNEALYRLRAAVEWIHVADGAASEELAWGAQSDDRQ